MVLVIYDVVDDGKRLKVAECCQDYGLDRLQYSMFGGAIRPAQRKDLVKRLKLLFGKAEGRLTIVQVAEDDWAGRVEWINLPKDGKPKPAFRLSSPALLNAGATRPNDEAI